jgi:hypothetical protein
MSLTATGTSSVVIPLATTESLGVVSVGANLSIDENGVLSAEAPTPPYALPPATTSTLGGVIVPAGSGLNVDASGNLSVVMQTGDVFPTVQYTPTQPTGNGQTFPITIESVGTFNVIGQTPEGHFAYSVTYDVQFPNATEDGQSFEVIAMPNPNYEPTYTTALVWGGSTYPAVATLSEGTVYKFRWSAPLATWFLIATS